MSSFEIYKTHLTKRVFDAGAGTAKPSNWENAWSYRTPRNGSLQRQAHAVLVRST